MFIWVLLASGPAWIMGAGRAQAAACLDGAGPRGAGRVSERTGVPVVMGLVSGAVSLVAMLVNLLLTGGDGQKYFSAALTVAIALIVLAYLLIFPAFLALRIRRRTWPGRSGCPGGIARRVAGHDPVDRLVTARHASACCGRASAPPIPMPSLPAGFEGERVQFELLVLSPVACVVLAATVFHVSRR